MQLLMNVRCLAWHPNLVGSIWETCMHPFPKETSLHWSDACTSWSCVKYSPWLIFRLKLAMSTILSFCLNTTLILKMLIPPPPVLFGPIFCLLAVGASFYLDEWFPSLISSTDEMGCHWKQERASEGNANEEANIFTRCAGKRFFKKQVGFQHCWK